MSDLNRAGDLLWAAYRATGAPDYMLPGAPDTPLDLPLVRRKIVEAAEIVREHANPKGLRLFMPDQKKINRLKLMLTQATRCLEAADPDLRVVEKLIADALNLAVSITEPPDLYADRTLRPGLTLENPDG